MAYKQGFETRSVQLQEGLLSSMAKIEALAAQNQKSIEVITGGVIQTVNTLEKILQENEKQTAVLRRIEANMVLSNAKLDAISKGYSTTRENSADKISQVAVGLGTTAKNIALMAAAIAAFGIAIGIASAFVLNPVGVLAIAFAIGIIVPAFAYAAKKMEDLDQEQINRAALAMPLMALGVLGAAVVFAMMPPLDASMAPDPVWVLKTGLALSIFAIPFAVIASKKLDNVKQLALTAAAIPLLALGLVGAAYAFELLPDDYKAPDPVWALQVGLSFIVFSIPFLIVAASIDQFNMTPKDLLFAGLANVVLAGSILGIAWIFTGLPDEYKAPELGWLFTVGVGMIPFALSVGLIGAIVQAVSIQGFLLGAAGLVIAGLSAVGLAYVFKLLPEDMFKPGGFLYDVADTMAYFGMKMVDVFIYLLDKGVPVFAKVVSILGPIIGDIIVKIATPLKTIFSGIAEVVTAFVPIFVSAFGAIKDIIVASIQGIVQAIFVLGDFITKMNNIGAENLVLIGGGLLSIAGGLAAITAASIGASLGGAVSSALGAVGNLISFIAGDEPAMRPEEIVIALADRQKAIEATANGIAKINSSLSKINAIQSVTGLDVFYKSLNRFFYDGLDEKPITSVFASSMDRVNRSLDRLVKFQSPLAAMATSFTSIASSMQKFSTAINTMELAKATKTYEILAEINDMAAQSGGFNQVVDFAGKAVDKAFEFASSIVGGGGDKEEKGAPAGKAAAATPASNQELMILLKNLPSAISVAVASTRIELRDATGGKLIATT